MGAAWDASGVTTVAADAADSYGVHGAVVTAGGPRFFVGAGGQDYSTHLTMPGTPVETRGLGANTEAAAGAARVALGTPCVRAASGTRLTVGAAVPGYGPPVAWMSAPGMPGDHGASFSAVASAGHAATGY